MVDKEQELINLENRLFMLNMVDKWDASDFKLSDQLHSRIIELRKEIENG